MARPLETSIWRFSDQLRVQETSDLYTSRRVPFGFLDEGIDAVTYKVQQGDFLEFVCRGAYDGVVERPHELWRQVADFQPVPILDPFSLLEPGRVLILPSRTLMTNLVLNERARVADL